MEYSIFESEIRVRPSDIDINQHVHYSKYLEYLLAARYEQMGRDYGMSMEEFIELGYSWVASSVNIDYKRGLKINDTALVRTQIDSIGSHQVTVKFWVNNKETGKVCSEGKAVYTLISIKTGRIAKIPEEIIAKYAI